MSNNYTGDQIEVLRGLEAVRKRPGMYIGNTAERGLHQLVYEAVDNAVDEALAGYAKNVSVTLYKDGSCSVEDDGRGIPVDIHAEEKIPAVEVVMTMLHAGGKFGKGGYKVAGGLHGVGISVVNALSESMITTVRRDGNVYEMSFERGITTQKLKKTGKAEGSGTRQWFMPDTEMFEVTQFHWDVLQKRLRELAFLNRGLSITLRDERGDEPRERNYKFDGGIVSFVEWLNEKKDALHPIITTNSERDGVDVEVAMQYTDTYSDQIFSYANNINTIEGGMHLLGFRTAVTNAINGYARKRGMLKESDGSLSTDDIMEGLTAVVSVKLQEPQFEGQTKTKLGNARVRSDRLRAGQRAARVLFGGEPEIRTRDRREDDAGAARPRSGEKSARPVAPQERPGGLGPSRQARGLQEHQSGRERTVSGRRRFGRRHRQRRPRSEHASHPAAARQDPQRRESAAGQGALERRDSHDDHRAGNGIRRRIRRRQAAVSQDHHHDRRRRGRIAHPHAAAHVLLPSDEAAGRAGPRVHRAAAALRHSQGQEAVVGF